MTHYRIAVIPGDGIGPEVIAEGVKVLDEIARLDGGFTFEWTYFPWGCNYYLEKGRMMAEAGVRIKVDLGGVQGSLFAALIAMKQKSCSLSRAAACCCSYTLDREGISVTQASDLRNRSPAGHE